MRNLIRKTAILLVSGIFLSSCASIIHGSNQTVDFTSQPSGATITIDGRKIGVTPKSIPLKRKGRLPGEVSGKKEYQVKIEMDGYYPYEIKIKREVDGWFFGNLIFGGLLGIIIDAGTGNMYKLSPNQVVAQMGKSTGMIYKKTDGIYFAVTMTPDPTWEKIGKLKKQD
jgi:hypothetical protein